LQQPADETDIITEMEHLFFTSRDQLPGVGLLIDRFDALEQIQDSAAVYSNLRALRDAHKYWLTLVPGTRHPLDSHTELAELCFAHNVWVGPLNESDGRWTIEEYAQRVGQNWNEQIIRTILDFSWRYPSFLRGICEAYASSASLDLEVLRVHPAMERRIDEFWAGHPDEHSIANSGLLGHPLLASNSVRTIQESKLDQGQFTAKEHPLWEYFRAHPSQVCEKDDLIRAIWAEVIIYTEGIRDDTLAQLVRRLRVKIEPDLVAPVFIHTVPGRGYRYIPG
jgi:DNA-binding winged helix-turn-helix (wHTH) protein